VNCLLPSEFIDFPEKHLHWVQDYHFNIKGRVEGCWRASSVLGTKYVITLPSGHLAAPFCVFGGCSGFACSFDGAASIAENHAARQIAALEVK
jgi:hypothetical protein